MENPKQPSTDLACKVCGAKGPHQLYTVSEMMFGTREPFDYLHCSQCGCLQIAKFPDDIAKYYPDDYYSFGGPGDQPHQVPRIRRTLEQWRVGYHLFGHGFRKSRLAGHFVSAPEALKSVERLLRPCNPKSFEAAFLDVGCGSTSWWLTQLQRLGFTNLTGADAFIAAGTDRDGIRILRATLEQVEGKFDVISFHHSLEHMPHQVEVLQAAKARLKPGGCCLIRIPLVSSAVWERYGTDWVELDAPRHFFLHSKKSIELAASQAGLRLVDHFCDAIEFEYWGSEQYVRGIPLRSQKSFADNPDNSDFTFKEMAEFRRLASEANAQGRGGRAAFFFQAA